MQGTTSQRQKLKVMTGNQETDRKEGWRKRRLLSSTLGGLSHTLLTSLLPVPVELRARDDGGGCLLVNAVWKLEVACLHVVAGVPQIRSCCWSSIDVVEAWEEPLWIWKEFGGDRDGDMS